MLPAPKLSALTGAEVYVKYENLQVTNSFKDRGALVKLASLSEAERKRGVIAMSAGNHAQAVAYHAARLGIPATIVMPVTTPFVKVAATTLYGAEVVLHGETVAEAQARCETIRPQRGLVLVHPYDDPRIIAGQGTIALEMLEDVPRARRAGDPDRRRRADRRQRHRGAREKAGHRDRRRRSRALSLDLERAARRTIVRSAAPTLAEGIAVKNVGKLTLPVVRELVCRHRAGRRGAPRARGQRLSDLAEDDGGRRGRRRPCRHAGEAGTVSRQARSGSILCGGNIDPRILASIMVRELERDDRIVSFRLTIPDRPGVLGTDRHAARRARRQYSRGRSSPAVSRCAGQGRQARRHRRDARRRACRRDHGRRSRLTAMGRCGSKRARRWNERGSGCRRLRLRFR